MIKGFILAATFTALAGCSFLPKKNGDTEIVTDWDIHGKLGARSKEESVAGFLTWKQRGDKYNIFLSGAFGQGATQIEGNDQQIKVVTGEQEYRSDRPEELLHQSFGWQFPINSLLYWVQGQPNPDQQFDAKYDDKGYLTNLSQSDWSVSYHRYEYRQGLYLPSFIRMKKQDWTLTFAIKQWQINDRGLF